jgi:hypothetical protein
MYSIILKYFSQIRIVLGLRNPVNPKHYINQSNKTISACNFNESSKKNMMVKTFLDGLKDFQLRCPYKKVKNPNSTYIIIFLRHI